MDGAARLVIHGGASLSQAGPGDVSFVRPTKSQVAPVLGENAPSLLIAQEGLTSVEVEALRVGGVAALIVSSNARLDFIRVLAKLAQSSSRVPGAIHRSAVVSPHAQLGADVVIRSNAVVGAARIGARCVFQEGAFVGDGTIVEADCIIFPGAVIGADGFGFERDEAGVPVRFPHQGRVVIGRGVEVGANACIDRGALSDTVIGNDTKIDNLVHIAHNVRIGERCLIAANALVGGSCVIGDGVWIGPSATISNGLLIGTGATISLGAVVTKNVMPYHRVTGNFAIDHEQFLRRLREERGGT